MHGIGLGSRRRYSGVRSIPAAAVAMQVFVDAASTESGQFAQVILSISKQCSVGFKRAHAAISNNATPISFTDGQGQVFQVSVSPVAALLGS
jgi:hypothetical protein